MPRGTIWSTSSFFWNCADLRFPKGLAVCVFEGVFPQTIILKEGLQKFCSFEKVLICCRCHGYHSCTLTQPMMKLDFPEGHCLSWGERATALRVNYTCFQCKGKAHWFYILYMSEWAQPGVQRLWCQGLAQTAGSKWSLSSWQLVSCVFLWPWSTQCLVVKRTIITHWF